MIGWRLVGDPKEVSGSAGMGATALALLELLFGVGWHAAIAVGSTAGS